MSGKALGGGDWSVVGTGGQRGISNARGLNNIGLLVRTWGQFHLIDATTFTVDDGVGLSVRCTVPSGTFLSSTWQNVVVTGISSMYNLDTSYLPLLLVPVDGIDVITPVEAVSTPGTPSGEISPLISMSYGYSTTGSTCSQGHTVEYSFNWGDGSSSSSWSTSTTATHVWTTTGAKTVTVTARCHTHPALTATSAGRQVTPVALLASAPWPMFRHDIKHSGVSPYHDPVAVLPVWSYTMGESGGGSGLSSPAIGRDGTIYITGGTTLYALDPNGTRKWSYAISAGASSARSSPAIASDGTVYVGGNNVLYAVNPNGTYKWNCAVSGAITNSPTIGPDGVIYIATQSTGNLYAINSTGSQKWLKTGLGGMHVTSPTVSADGATVYIAGGSTLWAFNTAGSGSQKWTYGIGASTTSSAALSPDGSTVYVGSGNGYLYAVRSSNGSFVWRTWVSFKASVTSASPAVGPDGTIYQGSNYGSLYAVNPDGTEKWIFESKSDDIRSSVAINSDGTAILASYDGYVRGLDSSTGAEKWHHLLPGNNFASPAITVNGTIVMATMSGIVYGNIGGTPPATVPPSDLTITMPSDTQALLSWHDNSSDEWGFRVERRMGTTGTYSTLANLGAGVTTYTDSGLLSGMTYYYRVCAYQSGGNSAYSNEAYAITPGVQAPSGLAATTVSASQVNLSWTDRSSDEIAFIIERSQGPNGLFEEIAQVGVDVTSYSDMRVYPARNYYYRVKAFDGTRLSSPSNEAWALTPGKDFSDVSRGNLSRKQIALTFDAGTAAIQSALLDTLKSNNVFSTFFITGYVTEVQGALVGRIGSEGHHVSNHTYDHPNLTYCTDEQIAWQLNTADSIIRSASGHYTQSYFRSPYGSRDAHVLAAAASVGFRHVGWSSASHDDSGASASEIIANVNNDVSGASNGGNGLIVLFHCTMATTKDAIPTVITNLRSQLFELVTVPEVVAPTQVTSPAGFLQAGWNLISLPIEPALEFPHIVFRGLTIDSIVSPHLKRWDRKTGAEVIYSSTTPGPFGNVYADEGYWLYVSGTPTIKFNGAAATTDRRIKLPNTTDPAAYALIGYPFQTAQSFSNCMVYNPNAAAPQTRTMAEAIAANWIPDTFYGWDAVTQTQYVVTLSSAMLEPWKGYKAAALVPGVELIIPKP